MKVLLSEELRKNKDYCGLQHYTPSWIQSVL